MDEKKPWADEPTPLCEQAFEGDYSVGLLPECRDRTEEHEFAKSLERRLRHALKLVNSLRIDATLLADPAAPRHRSDVVDPELLEQRLADIEEALSP